MKNAEALQSLLNDLRAQLPAVNGNPLMPGAVKAAVVTTFRILEILIEEKTTDGQA
jgi:hypothetical protein